MIYDFVADVPVVLHVCQIWRAEAEKIFIVIKGEDPSQRCVYFDFKIDLLYLRQAYTQASTISAKGLYCSL